MVARARIDIKHDRHRAVVHEFELHLRAEDARLDRHAELAQFVAEPLIEGSSDLWPPPSRSPA